MERILVGMDGSAAAADALGWAATLADAMGAEVRAVNAFENPVAEVSPEVHDQLMAQRGADLGAWIAAATTGAALVTPVVRDGDPREVLLAESEDAHVDALVLGRTGAGGGPGFLHLGSVVEYAAHHTSVPLAVIPTGGRGQPRRVIVGVDGSPESLASVAWVASLAPIGPDVIAVQVAEPFVEWTPANSSDNWRHTVKRELERWTAPLTEAGLSVRPVAQHDLHPADGLLDASSEWRADLLVVGTRGRGGFLGLTAGGVALKVLHRTDLPVVLVPAK